MLTAQKISFIKLYKAIFFLLSVLLIYMAAFRSNEIDRDYKNYVEIFNNINGIQKGKIEITFIWFSQLIKQQAGGVVCLFILYALLGIGLKIFAITRLTPFWILTLLVYFSHFYMLHDLTQIRTGVASGLLLISILPIYNRRFIQFFILSILAVLFHYSALIVFPLYFLKPDRLDKRIYFSILMFSYLFYFFGFSLKNFISIIPIDYIQTKLFTYISLANQGKDIPTNVFSFLQIFRLLICVIIIIFYESMYSKNKYSILLIKIYVISVASYVIFYDIPTLSFRISSYMGIVEIIIIPFLIYILKPQKYATILIFMICFFYLSLNIFYIHLLNI